MVVIVLFMLLLVTLILYARAKRNSLNTSSCRSHRLVFAPNEPTFPRFALDPLSFGSLPVTVFRSEDYKKAGGLEYVFCISELIDEEHARMLPKCNHGFHVDCIDMCFIPTLPALYAQALQASISLWIQLGHQWRLQPHSRRCIQNMGILLILARSQAKGLRTQ